jgi:HAD superfamily hydrolase (TIGR01450 family)
MEGDRTQLPGRAIMRGMPVRGESRLLASEQPLVRRYDVALLDLDGVVYLGREPIPGVAEALGAARAAGMRLAFVTNNAARPPAAVAAHLRELGVPADEAEVTTSAQAAAHYLAERLAPGSRVLVVGTTGLVEALRERGLQPVERDDETVAAVVQGYSPELTWKQLAQGCLAINRGALWVATNLDPTVPSPVGRLPGNGSMVAALRHATGATPVATGKPDPTMHRESVERSGAENPLVVGDRLDTDIEGASAVGCASLLVLTGVTGVAELLAAPERLRPGYLARDVGGLLQPHPAARQNDEGWSCRGWHAARTEAGAILLRCNDSARPDAGSDNAGTGSGPGPAADAPGADLDPVRALCAAAWQDSRGGDRVRCAAGDEASERVLADFGLA